MKYKSNYRLIMLVDSRLEIFLVVNTPIILDETLSHILLIMLTRFNAPWPKGYNSYVSKIIYKSMSLGVHFNTLLIKWRKDKAYCSIRWKEGGTHFDPCSWHWSDSVNFSLVLNLYTETRRLPLFWKTLISLISYFYRSIVLLFSHLLVLVSEIETGLKAFLTCSMLHQAHISSLNNITVEKILNLSLSNCLHLNLPFVLSDIK